MGKRGPKPKPTAIRIHEGSRIRKPAAAAQEPKPATATAMPKPPNYLEYHGKKEWVRVAPLLREVGCLTDIDLTLLAQFCSAHDDYHRCVTAIKKNGVICVGATGGDIMNPAFRGKYLASALIAKIGAMFGFSPTSRVGMSGAPQDEGFDDLESFKRDQA